LTEIVAIVVHHKVTQVILNFTEKEFNNLTLALSDLLLQESTASLFEGEFMHVSSDDFKFIGLILGFFILLDDLLN